MKRRWYRFLIWLETFCFAFVLWLEDRIIGSEVRRAYGRSVKERLSSEELQEVLDVIQRRIQTTGVTDRDSISQRFGSFIAQVRGKKRRLDSVREFGD